jgi:hypothetical protein
MDLVHCHDEQLVPQGVVWMMSTLPATLRRPPLTFSKIATSASLYEGNLERLFYLECVPACVMLLHFTPMQLSYRGALCRVFWQLVRPPREGKLHEVFQSS